MKNYATEVVNFFLNIASILKIWFLKYGFQNLVIIAIAAGFAFFGKWFIAWSLLVYFLGRNVEAIKKVWSEVKKDFNL